VIPNSAEKNQRDMENVEVSSGSAVALSQHLLSFLFDIWQAQSQYFKLA